MSKHQWSVLCNKSIIDKDENTISLIESLEEITLIAQVPEAVKEKVSKIKGNTSMGFQLVSLWIRSDRNKPEKDYARIQVKGPNDDEIVNQEYKIDLTDSIRTRQKMNFQGIPYKGAGTYKYITQQKKGTEKSPRWVTVSELYLDLKQIKEEESP